MKHAGHFIGIAGIFCLFFFVGIDLELWFLDSNPPQLPSNLTLGEWKASFELWISVCVGCAGAASLLWYILAQWIFKINRWQDTEKRSTWIWLYFLLPFAAFIISVICVKRTDSSQTWIYLFFFLTGLVHYYIATLLFSPSSFKFTPIGAKYIRHW